MTNPQKQDDMFARPNSLTVGAITASLAFIMELSLLPLILNAIKIDLALSVGGLAWVFNGYAIAVALAVLCVGLLGDLLNKRKLFMFGVSLFSFGSLLSAMSSDISSLVLSRVLQGVGGGLFFPLVAVLLTQANAKGAGRILMIWGGLAGVAAAVLPILGMSLLAKFGWPAIFLSFTAVSILALIFVASSKAPDNGSSPGGAPDYRQLFAIRGYWLILLYIFLTYGCFSFYLFHFTVNWHDRGFTDRSVSVFLLCVWISFSATSFALRDRIEGSELYGSLIAAPGLIFLSFLMALIDMSGAHVQALSAIMVGAGLACCNSPSTHLLLRKSPEDLRAMSSSLDIIFARCGSVLMVAALAELSPIGVMLAILSLTFIATSVAFAFRFAPPISN